MSAEKKTSVLFICLGNICRSPMAEAIFLHLIKERGIEEKFVVDSAAVINFHVGKGPEPRTLQTLAKHNISDYKHRVRMVTPADFDKFDYIFGMDEDNISDLESVPKGALAHRANVELLGKYDPEGVLIIPDPYYQSGTKAFDEVYELCMRSCTGFLNHLKP